MALPLLALAALPSLVKGVSGIVQASKGRKLAKANVRPQYEIPKEFQQNVAMAENMARTGLPQEQYNNQLNNIQRNQAGALGSFGRRGGATGSLASIVRAGNDATNNLVSQDAQARMQNQRFAFGQRGIMGQQRLAKWDWDKRQKYQENAQAASALQSAGRQNMMGALDGLSSLGQTAIMGGMGGGSKGVSALQKGWQMQQQSGLGYYNDNPNTMNG